MEHKNKEVLDEPLYRIHMANDWIASKNKWQIKINNPNAKNPTQFSGHPPATAESQ